MAGARGPTRRDLVVRLFGARNRRRERGTVRPLAWARGPFGRGLAGAALAGGVVVAWPTLARVVVAHSYFAVREVAVHGQRRLAADAVRRLAGVAPGQSIWEVDCAESERRLLREPWVRAARVARELPHRVVIRVREERPVAILAAGGARRGTPAVPALYYVAAPGRVVAPVGAAEPRDFPYVTGLSARDLDGKGTAGPRALRRALRLLRLAARTRPVSEIHVDRERGLTLLPVSPGVPIELGWTRFAERLARLPAVMALWRGREAAIAAVSLRVEGEVIVRTRDPKPGTPPRPARS